MARHRISLDQRARMAMSDLEIPVSKGSREPAVRVWLVLWKATHAIQKNAVRSVSALGLGLSDFAVLEVLLHKGPLPVNTIGPIVDLTPGSISVAVDRLFAKGLVS